MKDISINTGMNVFKENLINLIGSSQLPIGVTYYVLKDIFQNIEMLYNETLEKEKKDILSSMEKEKEEVEENNDKEQE